MKAVELRERFLKFFEKRGHKIIPSSPLIPQKDQQLEGTDEVLFVSAGMQPLIPYLTGKKEPPAKKLVSSQKCLRTDDIEEVGDLVHHTFFEMLGNWSIGNAYWKKEAIEMSLEFLTEELEIPVEKLAVSVFAGDNDAPRDKESAEIWNGLGIPKERIFYLGKEHNWWPTGKGEQDSGEFKGPFGPCGPDTEMFVWTGEGDPKGSPDKDLDWVEVWNDVFMEFNRNKDGSLEDLPQKNIDTGMGLERILAVLNGKESAYETELFSEVINLIESKAQNHEIYHVRKIADYLRAVTFLVAEKKVPLASDDDRGSVLVKLVTKSYISAREIGLDNNVLSQIPELFIKLYKDQYPELEKVSDVVKESLSKGYDLYFRKALSESSKKRREEEIKDISEHCDEEELQSYNAKKAKTISGIPFKSFDELHKQYPKSLSTVSGTIGTVSADMKMTYGIPIEESYRTAQQFLGSKFKREEADKNLSVMEELQKKASRGSQKQKFAGGLADQSEKVVRGHTATHLLHQSLRDVLGDQVHQTGSNITAERMRFDFSYGEKMTSEQKERVEKIVNEKIKEDIKVTKTLMTQEEAKKKGAIGLFPEKYEGKVSIYQIGPSTGSTGSPQAGSGSKPYSIEYCGGPHVKNTGKIGKFKIVKEESVGAGNRRIKATLD